MATKRAIPITFLIVGGLFALAAIRDVFFPHFFAVGVGHATANAALAVFFIALGAGRMAFSTRPGH